MKPHKAVLSVGGLGQLVNREGRSVGGQNRMGSTHLVQPRKKIFLDRQVFKDRFDDEIAVLGLGQVGCALNPGEDFVDLFRPEDFSFHSLLERTPDIAHSPFNKLLDDLFAKVDENSDGSISKDELSALMKKLLEDLGNT